MTAPRGASPFEPGDVTMRTCLGVAILLAFVPTAVGADDPESLLKEVTATHTEAATVLKSITDRASAEAGLSKLKALDERVDVVCKKLKALGELSEEQKRQLRPQFAEVLKAIQDLLREKARIEKLPAAAAVLKDVFPLKQGDEKKAALAVMGLDRITVARSDTLRFTLALEIYKVKHGKYPATLAALAEKQPDGGPVLVPAELLNDPWGRAYRYDPAGPKNEGFKPDVWSTGPDPKKPDGVIGNWQQYNR
jgi:hypothetical protein